MKFTKLIKVILPVATISGVAPFVANCGCGNNTYVINYGDTVDCLNTNAKDYHKLDDVRKAIVNKADRETTSSVKIEDITTRVQKTEIGIQNFYYDIIAGSTVVHQWEMHITDWKASKDAEGVYHIKLSINFGAGLNTYESLLPSYRIFENSIYIYLNNTKVCKSYTYQNCVGE